MPSRPRVDEILDCIATTLDDYIAPDLTDPYAKSMAMVSGGLLRLVVARVEAEGQALVDDRHGLRKALREALELLGSPLLDGREGTDAVLATIARVLEKKFRGAREYPTLNSLADEVAELSDALDTANRLLIAAGKESGAVRTDDRYVAVRSEIRGFITAQLEREIALSAGVTINPGI